MKHKVSINIDVQSHQLFPHGINPEDLSPEFPAEARRINQRSLAELNAFIDILETKIFRGWIWEEKETRQICHTFVTCNIENICKNHIFFDTIKQCCIALDIVVFFLVQNSIYIYCFGGSFRSCRICRWFHSSLHVF